MKRSKLKFLCLLPRYVGYVVSLVMPLITMMSGMHELKSQSIEELLSGSVVSGSMIAVLVVASVPQLMRLAMDVIPRGRQVIGTWQFWAFMVFFTFLARKCIDLICHVSLMCLIGKLSGSVFSFASDKLMKHYGFDPPRVKPKEPTNG